MIGSCFKRFNQISPSSDVFRPRRSPTKKHWRLRTAKSKEQSLDNVRAIDGPTSNNRFARRRKTKPMPPTRRARIASNRQIPPCSITSSFLDHLTNRRSTQHSILMITVILHHFNDRTYIGFIGLHRGQARDGNAASGNGDRRAASDFVEQLREMRSYLGRTDSFHPINPLRSRKMDPTRCRFARLINQFNPSPWYFPRIPRSK